MTILVFGGLLDEKLQENVAKLLGQPKVMGVCTGTYISSSATTSGTLSNLDCKKIIYALFTQLASRDVSYTLMDIEVAEDTLFVLHFNENLRFLGVLNSAVVNDKVLDELNSKFHDLQKIYAVINDPFAYSKFDGSTRVRDDVLKDISDNELRERVMKKGMGKKRLAEVANELQVKIEAMPLMKKIS